MRRPLRVILTLAMLCFAALGVTSADAKTTAKAKHKPAKPAGLSAPTPQSPANGASVQSLPAIAWSAVPGAALYEYQVAADPRFDSVVLGAGPGNGSSRTHSTAAALGKSVPDGTYYWRVRAINAKDAPGSWSATRTMVKSWSAAPQTLGPTALSVAWPSNPLILSWSAVPYATKYIVTIATDPALSNIVVGSAASPQETQGTVFALPSSLAPGQYFWAITPEDAEGHRGTRSRVASFNWVWPTATTTSIADLNPNPQVFDPQFAWAPVPGAAKYEVEVNSAQDFPAGSKWCCTDLTTGTSLSPKQVLGNNGYYWRVRAIDPRGHAGVWNAGQSFTKAFDGVSPTIPDLTMRDVIGNAQSGMPYVTDTPIVTWSAVPGASRYEVQVGDYVTSLGCDWSNQINLRTYETASTAWTPLGSGPRPVGSSAWPSAQQNTPQLATGGAQYCLRVLARSDDDAKGHQVVSDWTQINGLNQPAFQFNSPPTTGTPTSPFETPASAYLMPASGTATPRTPLFTWNRVPGAQSYYIVIARDAGFTQIATIGFTHVPAYAPQLSSLTNPEPLADETTAYYWAVIPATGSDGSGVFSNPPEQDNPQWFNKSSTPPTPLGPGNGSTVSAQPSFSWTPAENARNYTLQVSQDPSFGNPIDNVTTDSTAFTSSSTYPADTVLYWRVRANDRNGQGLNWSPTETFRRTLPVPAPAANNSSRGEQIPALAWNPVQGAVAYDMHVDQSDGTTHNFTIDSPVLTPTLFYGIGIWRWEVRAEFPTSTGANVAGGYFAPQQFVRTLAPPTGAVGTKAGTRIVLGWNPDSAAKQYQVDVSTTSGFSSTLDSHRIDGTSWAPDIDFTRPQAQGTLYWRVAAIDQGGNIGQFAAGAFAGQRARATARCVAKTKHAKRKHKAHKSRASAKPKSQSCASSKKRHRTKRPSRRKG